MSGLGSQAKTGFRQGEAKLDNAASSASKSAQDTIDRASKGLKEGAAEANKGAANARAKGVDLLVSSNAPSHVSCNVISLYDEGTVLAS